MGEKSSRSTVPDMKIEQKHKKHIQIETPASTILEQIDQSTLHIIQQLFTKPGNGMAFLASILHFAEVQQMALPGIEGTTNVAVISLQTIRELAQKIRWGYDTTHKYVVVFCALNLLMKRRSEGRIQLLFPLEQYTPPSTLQALDKLIEHSRPKVQQFARRVKHRCILYDILPQERGLMEEYSTREQRLLLQLQSILQDEHIEPVKRQRLLQRISSEVICQLLTTSGTSESHVLPSGNLTAEQEKVEQAAPSRVVDSFPTPSLIEKATHMHEPTFDQIDLTACSELFSAEEWAQEILEGDKDEEPEQDETSESALEELIQEASEETSIADERAYAKEALTQFFAHTEQKKSPRTGSSVTSSSSFTHSGQTSTWKDYPGQSVPGKKEAVSPPSREKSSSVEENVQKVFSTDKPAEDEQPEVAPVEQKKSPHEEKSPEPAVVTKDAAKDGVDFSAITQIAITGYSTVFLRAYVTFNVIEFINNNYNNNVNVTSRDELAKFLSEILDGNQSKWLIYKKKFGKCGPDAIVGALIFTLTSLYDRGGESITNKAALFMKRCDEYQASGVPPHIVTLTNSLKHYTFEKMISFFKERQQLVKDPRATNQESATSVQQNAKPANTLSVFDAGTALSEGGTAMARQGRNVVVWRPAGGPAGRKKKRHSDLFTKKDL